MSQRPRLTIDTNCVINLFDVNSQTATSVEPLAALLAYGLDGKAEIAITTRTEADLLKDGDEQRREALLARLAAMPVVSSIGRWDVSKWTSDAWADEPTNKLAEEIKQILFPGLTPNDKRFGNKVNDVDHLVGHMIDRRDIFVTDDRGILKRREKLERGPGIVVMTPAECQAHIDGIAARSRPRTLPSEGINPAYHSAALRGTATFDYSNNEHVYAIGEGQALFETKWSKASDVSIHAYRDGSSVSAVALATGISEIGEIRDASAYDFSSRTRTPRVGQIVIWRNLNGLYAATKIIGIKDDSRGADHDELSFDYVILPDGGTDFGT